MTEKIPNYVVAIFFALVLILFWAVTRIELLPDGSWQIVSPHVISGDEPHHLLVTNSLLFDHDFQLQNDYERAKSGLESGGVILPDHHTILVNRRDGRHGVWFDDHWDPDFQPGPDVYEVSSHPWAYPALLAAMVFPFRPRMDHVERDASGGVVVICWLGAIFTFLLARRVGMDRGDALFATALLACASPWLGYTRSFFAEPAIGLSAAISLWALEAERPYLTGAAAAAAAIFKPPLAVIGGGFGIDLAQRRRWHQLMQMLVVLIVAGLALVSINYYLARTPIISGNGTGPWPIGDDTAQNFGELADTFLGGAHGLFVWVPWSIFAVFPIGWAFCKADAAPRFLREMSIPMALQLLILSASNFGPAVCFGPRYWVPFLPWMAVAAVYTFRSSGWFWKGTFAVFAVVSLGFAIFGALRYPQMYAASPWYLWHALPPAPQ